MPEYILNNLDREFFFNQYISTYIEKDVSSAIESGNKSTFLKFLSYIALRTSAQIDYEDISRNIGIDVRTVKRWLSILETSGIIVLLEPFSSNLSDRLIKTPKLYFMDTGLCSFLCKWPNAEMLENGIMNGAFYETYVVSEIIKSYYNTGKEIKISNNIYYYRDKDQKEIDLIIEDVAHYILLKLKKASIVFQIKKF